HQQHETVLRPAEGRHQLSPVLDRQTTRRPRPGINKPAAKAQARLHGDHRPLQRSPSSPHGRDRVKLRLQHRVDDLPGLQDIDAAIAGTGAFSSHFRAHLFRAYAFRALPTSNIGYTTYSTLHHYYAFLWEDVEHAH